MNILTIKDLSFGYEQANNILENFSLTVNEGDMVLLDGASGSGKSTLIHLIIGHIAPNSGTITVFGKDLSKLSSNGLAKMRRRIGIITQFNTLLKDMSVIENIMIPMFIDGKPYREAYAKSFELLQQVGLSHKHNKSVLELSGGEEQRVTICRALVNNPGILLADEATANLDANNADNVLSLCIEMVKRRNMPLLWTSHNLRQRHLFNRVITLNDRKLD